MARLAIFVFVSAVVLLSCFAGAQYSGRLFVYLLFSATANALLLSGFRKGALFFDTFIGIFLWLGFWLKLSIRVAFAGGGFAEPVGAFDGSPDSFDEVLLIAAAAFSALLSASFLRERFFSYPLEPPGCSESALFVFYCKYRCCVVVTFIAALLLFTISNAWLEIYQRGMVARTVLPFGLNGVYKWLLQFGFSSAVALIVRFELELGRKLTPLAIAAPIFESFMTNTAMLSRGMVLNTSAIALGGWRTMLSQNISISVFRLGAAAGLFLLAFAVSVVSVNHLRVARFNIDEVAIHSLPGGATQTMAVPLFIDRWVGIEGLMAVHSSQKKGWSLWNAAWNEKFQEGTLSLYDTIIISTPYALKEIDLSRNHFVSLPGIIAFLYYPGSTVFLCISLVVIAWFAALLEFLTFRYCGKNFVLCALFGEVVAFRFSSFGYVPAQSYLLFGSLLLNACIFVAAEQSLQVLSRKTSS